MMYSIDLISSNAAEGVEVLSDSVLNPKFYNWEVEEAIAKLKGDLEKYKSNAQNIMTEVSIFLMAQKKLASGLSNLKIDRHGISVPGLLQLLHSVTRCFTLSRSNRYTMPEQCLNDA